MLLREHCQRDDGVRLLDQDEWGLLKSFYSVN